MNNLLRFSIMRYLVFFIVVIAAYWQIAFLQNSVQYDLIDVVLPWRYYVTECFMNGEWPLWNPYQQCGYPIYADVQYPIFTPEVLFIAPTIGYTNITLHFLLLFYISMAGVGMYKLGTLILESRTGGLFAGIIYCLSGFFIGHASSLTLIIAGCWLPFVFYYFLKLYKTLHYNDMIKLSFTGLLMASSAYQPITFILIYLLLIFVVCFAFIAYKNHNIKAFYKWVGLLMASSTIILLCILPIIVGILDAFPYVTRMGEVAPENLVKGSFTVRSFISFFLPFGTAAGGNYELGTDISMANIYTGVLPLFLFVYSFFTKKNTELKIITWIAICTFLIAVGSELPFRIWVSKLPLMATFRFPSIFRLFTIFGIALLSAHTFLRMKQKVLHEKNIVLYISVFLIIFSVFFSLLYSKTDMLYWFETSNNSFKKLVVDSTLNQRLLLQIGVQLILVIVFFPCYYFSKLKHRFLFIWIVFDLIISVQLCIWGTGINEGKPLEIYSHLEKKPKGFPFPIQKPLSETTDISANFYPLWHNTNIFEKRISCDCMTSFVFKKHETLFNKYGFLGDSILQNPWYYLSDNIIPLSKLSTNKKITSDVIFVEDSSLLNIPRLKLFQEDNVKLISFSPNKWEFFSSTKHHVMFALLQSSYKKWKCFINGKQTKIQNVNLLFSGVLLNPGEKKIVFQFENKALDYSIYLSSFMLILLCCLFYRSIFYKS